MPNEPQIGFQTQIYNDLEEMPNRLTFPDKSNKGKMLSMLFMWKRIEQLAEKKYESHYDMLVKEGLIDDPKEITTPGNHMIGDSPKIRVDVNVSVPRRTLNVEWLTARLEKDYNIPQAVTRQLMEEAKRPGTTQTRKITVSEKGA